MLQSNYKDELSYQSGRTVAIVGLENSNIRNQKINLM
jgi:hypothetical protein